ncbi:uncharacterized protein LOC110862429 [Folsomia candida]|uniref:uncharacterized protein LOC110862429 n=1 Tax=Folsomia candida TaxID=158441 RepID=UPI000B90828B|nr:uncharacterized protein LOC110862429 [Folsomia candida]
MTNFKTKLLVMVFAVILFCSISSVDALIHGVDSTLSRLQRAISSSYEKFQAGESNYDFDRNFGDGVRILLDANDTIDLPTIGISPYFKISCTVSRLTELFGPTTIWASKLHGLSDMADDFNIKFINNEGDFIAHLAIQIPTFNAAGEYMTNLTLFPKHARTPDMYFLGNSSYSSSISFLEFGLEVEGRASAFENIFIRNVNLSFDYKDFDIQFSNLTLRSATSQPGASFEWFRQINTFSEIPKYFKWNWVLFHTTLDLSAVANEIGQCLLQNVFSECTLMDLLVSAECMKLNIDEECLRIDILDVYFPLQPGSSIKENDQRARRSCSDDYTCCFIPPTFGVSTSNSNHLVHQVAAKFGDLILSGEKIFGLGRHNSSSRTVHTPTRGPVVDQVLSLPDAEAQVMWKAYNNDVFGGLFRTWGSEVRGHQNGKENLSTEFLDQNGTFVANYSVEFPAIYVSGNYDSDLTLYPDAGLFRDQGELSLIGAGRYNWTMKSVWINVEVFGRAPMTEKMSVSNVAISLGIERLQEREGLKFTALHNFLITYGGNLTTDKHPTYWGEVINHRVIEDFLFHDKNNEINVAFPEVVGKQLQCALDYAVGNCNILDVVVSGDCLRVDRNDNCFSDYVMTVRQPTTWSTAMTSEPETEFTEDETPTMTTHLATSTTVADTTSTTEAPDTPDSVVLLLNQTQILLDQAQLLLKIVQGQM